MYEKYILTEEGMREPFANAYKRYHRKCPNIYNELIGLGNLIEKGQFKHIKPCSVIQEIIDSDIVNNNIKLKKGKLIYYELYVVDKFIICGYIKKGKELFDLYITGDSLSENAERDYFVPMKIFYGDKATLKNLCSKNECIFWEEYTIKTKQVNI